MKSEANVTEYIDVAGSAWTIERFEPSSRGDDAMGRCDSLKGTIHISSALTQATEQLTVIHEWLHGVLDIYGLEHSEGLINVISNELYRKGFRIVTSKK